MEYCYQIYKLFPPRNTIHKLPDCSRSRKDVYAMVRTISPSRLRAWNFTRAEILGRGVHLRSSNPSRKEISRNPGILSFLPLLCFGRGPARSWQRTGFVITKILRLSRVPTWRPDQLSELPGHQDFNLFASKHYLISRTRSCQHFQGSDW